MRIARGPQSSSLLASRSSLSDPTRSSSSTSRTDTADTQTNTYGGREWTSMTAALNTAFGAGNVSQFSDLSELATLISYDPLWLDQPDWNAQIGGLVGGTVTDDCSITEGALAFAHALTAGVSGVHPGCSSSIAGGTSLFTNNFAALWGSKCRHSGH